MPKSSKLLIDENIIIQSIDLLKDKDMKGIKKIDLILKKTFNSDGF